MAFGFTVDENNVLGRQVEEAGTYNVRILPTSEAKVSKTGKEMMVLNFEVTDGKYAGGQIRYDNIVWDESDEEKKENSAKRFNTIAVAVGAKAGFSFTSIQQMTEALKGRELNISVEWGGPNDKGYYNLNVTGHNPKDPEGSQPNGMFKPARQQSGASAYNNPAVDKAAASLPNNFGTPSGDPFAGAGEVISDDDLPF